MTSEPDPRDDAIVRRHLRFGWAALLVFLSLGIALEALHGLKVGWYLDASNDTRRLLFRLGHAHGALLALVQVAFGLSVRALGGGPWAPLASRALLIGAVLVPVGFLLGGLVVYGGDPWVGILLVPVGAAALFVGVLVTVRGLGSRR